MVFVDSAANYVRIATLSIDRIESRIDLLNSICVFKNYVIEIGEIFSKIQSAIAVTLKS